MYVLYVCVVCKRPVPVDMPLRYYTAAMHSASFVLPGANTSIHIHTHYFYYERWIDSSLPDD